MDGQKNKQTLVIFYCGRGKYRGLTNPNTNIILIEDFKKIEDEEDLKNWKFSMYFYYIIVNHNDSTSKYIKKFQVFLNLVNLFCFKSLINKIFLFGVLSILYF